MSSPLQTYNQEDNSSARASSGANGTGDGREQQAPSNIQAQQQQGVSPRPMGSNSQAAGVAAVGQLFASHLAPFLQQMNVLRDELCELKQHIQVNQQQAGPAAATAVEGGATPSPNPSSPKKDRKKKAVEDDEDDEVTPDNRTTDKLVTLLLASDLREPTDPIAHRLQMFKSFEISAQLVVCYLKAGNTSDALVYAEALVRRAAAGIEVTNVVAPEPGRGLTVADKCFSLICNTEDFTKAVFKADKAVKNVKERAARSVPRKLGGDGASGSRSGVRHDFDRDRKEDLGRYKDFGRQYNRDQKRFKSDR